MKAIHKAVDIGRLSLYSLRVHAVRSVLTSLGIIFGVCGVIAMLGFTEGASRQSQAYLRELGSDKIIIRTVKPPAESSASGRRRGVRHYGLTQKDLDQLLGNVPDVVDHLTMHQSKQNVWRRINKATVSLVATWPELKRMASIDMAAGRFLHKADTTFGPRPRSPCVLPAALARRLFGPDDPLGKTVQIGMNREPFTVVGVLDRVPGIISVESGQPEDCIIIPEPVRTRRMGEFSIFIEQGNRQFELVEISQIVLQMADEQAVLAGAKVARSLLARTHDQADYQVHVPVELLEQKEKQNRLWSIVLLVIAGISLVVGGIGIMNIMLASVTERTREIGIRRALGARKADVAVQFLLEAVSLTTMGGLLGIAAGLAAAVGVNQWGALPFDITVTGWALLVPFLMAVAVGLVSGLYPAVRAANLDPIVALRHE